ncbi:MAG: hypothetical protein IJ175_03180 [Clostridia bacterium]|nr:hypothetical protein [Clostridia bacterium]
MNTYIKAQISNIITMCNVFKKSCELAAKKDDGIVNREEQKQLKEINKAVEEFIKKLEKIH